MEKFVEYTKLSKKVKKEYNKQNRVVFAMPSSTTFDHKKIYKRNKKVAIPIDI